MKAYRETTESKVKSIAISLAACYWRGRLHSAVGDGSLREEAMVAAAAEADWHYYRKAASALLERME